MTRCRVWRVVFTPLTLACVLFALGGCGSEPEDATPQRPRLVAEFFDGEKPISPVQWAGVSPPELEEGSPVLLASLHIREVVAKRILRGGGGFDGGITAHPEVNPTAHLIDDLDILKDLGRAGRLPLTWKETQREGRVIYRDDIVLPDGRRIIGAELAMYFASMALVASEGGLQEYEAERRLSDSLLMVGYSIYNSDSTIGSAKPRHLILSAAWGAAFALRQQRAVALSNHSEAELWARRSKELWDVFLELERMRVRKRDGG
jgi:hypothetical protein